MNFKLYFRLQRERNIENSKVISEIITLMYLTKDENFGKIEKLITTLEKDNNFKPPRKGDYIKLYKSIYEDMKKLRFQKEE